MHLATDKPEAPTGFLPAERASRVEIDRENRILADSPVVHALLESIPGIGLVLNQERQIVAANLRALAAAGVVSPELLLGKRPGEALSCIHSADGPGGCGTSEFCSVCGAALAIKETLEDGAPALRECRISTARIDSPALELEVVTRPMQLNGESFIVCTLRDVSAEKRRRVLERLFFHDVLNTAGGIQGLALLMAESPESKSEEDKEIALELVDAAGMLVDEIQAQRELAAAESGELALHLCPVDVIEVVHEIQEVFRSHLSAHRKGLQVVPVPSLQIRTDRILLRRVLVNLVKNAFEATPPFGVVRIAVSEDDGWVVFDVNNPTVMDREVQLQVFQRSFSTKEGVGRGIGTYSVKLLGETYLGGAVTFTSREPDGTTFRFAIPRRV